MAHLVPHHGLLDGGEVFQRRQKHMAPLRATDVFDEVAKLLAQGNKDLVLVLDGLCQGVRVMCSHVKWGRGRRPSRKGINSSRVRSAPRARAMVERRRMAFRRRMTSSCCVCGQSEAAWRPKDGKGNVWQCVAYLELIDEDGDGVELIVRVRRVSHGEQRGRAGSWLGLSEEGAGRVWLAADGRREESLIACKVLVGDVIC